MSDYLIQNDTLTAWADHARRIAETEDELNAAEIAEIISRTEGTVKSTGKYDVKALSARGSVIKSGMYDTGEIFAFPNKDGQNDMIDQFTNPDGTIEWKTIATFDGWTTTSPMGHGYVKVSNAPIDIGALYKPVDDCLVIVVNIENDNTAITLNIITPNGINIDWGDGTLEYSNNYLFSIAHTYSLQGKYLIKIQKTDKLQLSTSSIGGDSVTQAAITLIAIPKWVKLYNCLQNLVNLNTFLIEDGVDFMAYNDGTVKFSFFGCNSLEFVSFPSSVTNLGEAFDTADNVETHKIKNVVLPYGITSIPNSCFHNTSIERIIIPETVTTIGDWAFGNSYLLRDIIISGNIINIGMFIFGGCEALESIYVPDDLVTTYKNNANLSEYVDYIKPLSEYVATTTEEVTS